MLTIEEREIGTALKNAGHALREHLTTIDWEQRRYETARDIIAAEAARRDVTEDGVDRAISVADTLLTRLREKKS